jgi:hypothetical protein
MLGEREALVLDVQSMSVHGMTYVDVTVAFRDRSVHQARLGSESVPPDLKTGEEVLATEAVNMIVSIRRPS